MRIGDVQPTADYTRSGSIADPSVSSLPAQPVADRAAHDQLEVAALEPRQLLGEQRHTLAPRAGHARDVRAPEESRGAERVIEPVEIVVDVRERIGAPGVARR